MMMRALPGIIFCWLLFLAIPAQAQNTGIFKEAVDQGLFIYQGGVQLLTGLGALGIVSVGIMMMTGRMPWGWGFTLIGGLAVLAMSDELIDFILQEANAPQLSMPGGNSQFVKTGADAKGIADQFQGDTVDIAYLVAAIMVVVTGIMGVMGKFPWSWFFGITGGLLVIGAATEIISAFLA